MRRLEVVAGLIKKEGKFLLCQRKENDTFALFWEFPGGKVENTETQQQALRREIKEELGIEIEVGNLVRVFKDRVSSFEIEVYLYEVLSFRGEPSPIECKKLGFFSTGEIATLNLAPVDRKIFSFLSLHLS